MNRLLLSAAILIAVMAAADEPAINSVPRTIDVIATDNRGAHLAGLTQSISRFSRMENRARSRDSPLSREAPAALTCSPDAIS